MKIKWYGTATLLIESGATRVLIDPYLKGFNKRTYPVPVKEKVQAIFISHPHFDHFSDIDVFSGQSEQGVYVSQNGIRIAAERGFDTSRMHPIAAGEEYQIGSLKIRVLQGRHCVFDAATVLRIVFSPRTWVRIPTAIKLLKGMHDYKITDDIYVFEITDGEKRIVLLGSAGMDPTEAYPKNADLFVFPYQGRAKMYKYMEDFLRVFQPKKVIIDHFDDAFPPFTHKINVGRFVPTVKKTLPEAQAFVPGEGIWYEI